ncbi:exosortase X [Marinoscillum sp.]|uniref:exosortase X n=1 Tax=Marinoscillum sp. TaxID=2024838 RepID=UPI003BAB7731
MNNKVNSILRVFAIRAVILFIGWMVAYHGFIKPDGRANKWLTTKVVQSTKLGLNLLGFNTEYAYRNEYENDTSRFISIDNQPVVLVADECNGLELIALFIGFILCFPGPLKFKAIMISIGSLMVFLINVFREIILALNYKFLQETFDFNHKYTYVFIVYLLIFLLWRYWLNKYSSIGEKVSDAKN